MLNVDGVINGNYRCNLFGADLNRQWIEPSRKAHPTIYYAKNVRNSLCSLSERPRKNVNF
jgi:murein tripeptide amidase MpaA